MVTPNEKNPCECCHCRYMRRVQESRLRIHSVIPRKVATTLPDQGAASEKAPE